MVPVAGKDRISGQALGLVEKVRVGMSDSVTGQHLAISEYEASVAATDRLPTDNLVPVLLGLYGEVGSIMATSKKLHREREAYTAYQDAVEEEFGDALWYLAALCRRFDVVLADIMKRASGEEFLTEEKLSACDDVAAPVATVHAFKHLDEIDSLLMQLGQDAAGLTETRQGSAGDHQKLVTFTATYLKAIQATKLSLAKIMRKNVAKAHGRFLDLDRAKLPTFDADFPEDERIPDEFEIEIRQKTNKKSYLRWNGVYIGDPLSDNIADQDGYRFHDVFHFGHAAILHWSPTFRALIKHKRKSNPSVDEAQDSGRAIVIEEGLSAYIFSCAKDLNFFENQDSISFDLLKTIQTFVRGYEVEACPAKLWEDAILQGYEVFRRVRANDGGRIVGDKKNRKLSYKAAS